MKLTGRIAKAVALLALSLVLCTGVCLAWFLSKNDITTDGFKTSVIGNNIREFSVKAYKLQNTATEGVYEVVQNGGNFVEIEDGTMDEYAESFGNTCTAVLLEFTCSFVNAAGSNYAVYADCSDAVQSIEKATGSISHSFVCNLSDAVTMYGSTAPAGTTTKTVTRGATYEFTDGTAKNDLTLYSLDDSAEVTFYYVLDYDTFKIEALYNKLLDDSSLGGELTSTLYFDSDIEFSLEQV